ncbi:trypsin-like peptidase domain-containing protein [Reyranella soli]|uniref:trypsin-like peptidase domain-containing protein n=1 Tax=Reyranella soli TaxID=1230389 RepID=UPI0014793A28|nr:trypsin-like peptidase domain-containing protein [Reyranella soli]
MLADDLHGMPARMSDDGDQPTRQEAEQLLRSGLAKAMRETAAQYSVPLAWVYADQGRPVVPSNGSAFLLDCGEGPFLVTADHVLAGFLKDKADHADAKAILGETVIPLDERIIARDRAHDVATLRVTAVEVADLKRYGKVPLTGSQSKWPPAPPCVDRGVFFVGFPGGEGRKVEWKGGGRVDIEFEAYTALAVASSVSATGLSLLFEHEQSFDAGLRPRMPTRDNMGGCSGAPILTFVEQRRVFSWRLGGVVNEAVDGLVKAARADCINPDGTLNAHPDPLAYRRDRDLSAWEEGQSS